MMNTHAIKVLEYHKIKECLKQYAVSEQAKKLIDKLEPSTDKDVIEAWMLETTEARYIVDINQSVPLTSLEGIEGVANKAVKGIVLSPEDLAAVKGLLECVKRLKKFMNSMQAVAPTVAAYALSMFELADLYEEIDRCITNGRVDDRATPELAKIRKKIAIADERIKQKLNNILCSSAYSSIIQEAVISTRNGRYVIPIKKEHRRSFEGNVLDTSSSGSTLFIEPAVVARLQEELNILKIEEEKEEYRILAHMTGIVDSYSREISINTEAFIQYDFMVAKAKYSRSLGCCPVTLNEQNCINIKGGRHPLIGKSAVPLDFYIGSDYNVLVITGPNTGGKTVAIKTVGMMTLMVQSGLHVPVAEGSEFAIYNNVLADIGDGQSIEQSLSTFSSHVKNISAILEEADSKCLVIVDEVGAGTDPGEGMGFAVAVLEEVYRKGATMIATTHYSEIKDFAEKTPGFKNGCMDFDINSLRPLYKLRIGQPGESNAFLIALRLGISKKIIERAHEITYRESREYSYEDVFRYNEPVDIIEEKDTGCVINAKLSSTHIDANKTKDKKKMEDTGFNVGDCVYVSSMNRTGIVCERENSRGEVVVMVMKNKFKINKKRLSLYVEGKELYPENYDFDIVFESKEDRKKKKIMGKRHVKGVTIEKNGVD
ncbi:MAG: hypothetical protein N3B21_11560 [Clostridia bacterium]|nr:hypothetical protein [Clostridia bacterium]